MELRSSTRTQTVIKCLTGTVYFPSRTKSWFTAGGRIKSFGTLMRWIRYLPLKNSDWTPMMKIWFLAFLRTRLHHSLEAMIKHPRRNTRLNLVSWARRIKTKVKTRYVLFYYKTKRIWFSSISYLIKFVLIIFHYHYLVL